MECRKAQKFLLEAAEGTLRSELRIPFEEHMGRCPACRESFEFSRKTVASLRKIPPEQVPETIWRRVSAQIAQERTLPQHEPFGWWQRVLEFFDEISWGQKFAWSSALATALVILTVLSVWDAGRGPKFRVVDVAANPSMTFPSYLREHRNPAGQPISEGPMVLAFNTLGDGNR